MSKPALGRGLGALLGGSPPAKAPASAAPSTAGGADPFRRIQVGSIQPCSFQPRTDFSEEALRELADSIREHGVIEPLVVRTRADKKYEIIAGERRWRAAQLAGLTEVPAIVREADDRTALEMALIENLQRENLNPIEEAKGYAQLISQFELKQDEAAQKVGKSRAVVANALRLLKLPMTVQTEVRQGALSVGHAKVLLGLADAAEQEKAAGRVLKDSLNVRQTEELVEHWRLRAATPSQDKTPAAPPLRDPHVADMENRLRERFGAKVHLKYKQGKGSIEISFFNDDDLGRILAVAGVGVD
jgi:ParB family chromosome partitioning protein